MPEVGTINKIIGRRVWDSRGLPTVEVEISLSNGVTARGIAPAGASKGSGEAVELRDRDGRFAGRDVKRAIASVNGAIAEALPGRDVGNQAAIDGLLISLDGTPDKSRLGANAMIATSIAVAHAAALASKKPLWRYLSADRPVALPLPEVQIFGGGAHAGRRVDIQDFMIVAIGAEDYAQSLEWSADVYHAAGELMTAAGLRQGLADEGGFWPAFESNTQALEMLVRAIERAGYRPGEDIGISLDIAASEFGRGGSYRLGLDGLTLDTDGMIDLLSEWLGRFPIVAVEDPLAEDDPEGFEKFCRMYPKLVVVGDDFLVTSSSRIRDAHAARACNATLIKPNQVGTLTEALAALETARDAGWTTIVSARSGETEDVTIAHLAVGWRASMLKVGSFARSERMAKWNEGLRIAEQLPAHGALQPRSAFPWGR